MELTERELDFLHDAVDEILTRCNETYEYYATWWEDKITMEEMEELLMKIGSELS